MKDNLFWKRYLAALNQYKWAGLATYASLSALAWVTTTLQPEPKPIYTAQSVLLYQPPTEVAPATGQPATAQSLTVSPEFLTSDRVLNVTSQILLSKRQPIPAEMLRSQLKVTRDPNRENRFLIQYQSTDAQQTQLVVESWRNTVIHQNLIDKRKEAEVPITLLRKRRGQLADNLRDAEENLREFGKQEKPAIQAAVDGSLVSAITNIQQQRRQLRRELEGLDAEIKSIQTQMMRIQNQMGMTPEQLHVALALNSDPAIAGLKTKIDEIKLQLETQQRELRPKHPDIIALERQQSNYEAQLQNRVVEISGAGNSAPPTQDAAEIRRASGLEPARQELASRLLNLRTQRNRMAQELAVLSRSEPEIRQTYTDGTELKLGLDKRTKDVAHYRDAVDQNEKQLAAAELKKAETQSDWIRDGAPQVQAVQNWVLSRPVILLAGGAIGILGAGIVVLLLDALRSKILIPEEVEAILEQRVPLLGILPYIPKWASKASIPVLTTSDTRYLEPYELLRSRLLRNNLHRRSRERSPKVVLLSSIRDGEGKTVSAHNLAIASAKAGKKTLLIEANLRASSQLSALGVSLYPNPASHLLTDYFQITNVQSVPDVKNLFVWSSPGSVEQVTELLESDQAQDFFNQARQNFEFVVIDTSTLRFSDALLIEPFTDGLVLVARHNYTDRDSLKITVEKLADFSDIKFLGTILNHATTSASFAH
jgi:capsular exopolysaccharide synthesis family protein